MNIYTRITIVWNIHKSAIYAGNDLETGIILDKNIL